ncbi:hypothetical protein FISHEDRAFT_58246 [Fistulina hepatica ATCC 64428]|nr:hypothetical protein FISHEDRAFT_58246 [Fistulina hepatica ATCC 64428]
MDGWQGAEDEGDEAIRATNRMMNKVHRGRLVWKLSVASVAEEARSAIAKKEGEIDVQQSATRQIERVEHPYRGIMGRPRSEETLQSEDDECLSLVYGGEGGSSTKAGIGGTGGGACEMMGLGGGERYGVARDSVRRPLRFELVVNDVADKVKEAVEAGEEGVERGTEDCDFAFLNRASHSSRTRRCLRDLWMWLADRTERKGRWVGAGCLNVFAVETVRERGGDNGVNS